MQYLSALDKMKILWLQVDNGGPVEIIKEGFLLQSAENSSAVSLYKVCLEVFVVTGVTVCFFQNFKKRHCIFRKIGATVELETSKDRGSPGLSRLAVDGVMKGNKKGRTVIELFTSTGKQGHVVFTCETDAELDEWYQSLSAVLDKASKGAGTVHKVAHISKRATSFATRIWQSARLLCTRV